MKKAPERLTKTTLIQFEWQWKKTRSREGRNRYTENIPARTCRAWIEQYLIRALLELSLRWTVKRLSLAMNCNITSTNNEWSAQEGKKSSLPPKSMQNGPTVGCQTATNVRTGSDDFLLGDMTGMNLAGEFEHRCVWVFVRVRINVGLQRLQLVWIEENRVGI